MADFLRTLKDLRYKIFFGVLHDRRFPVVTLGNRSTDCAWTFCPQTIGAQSIVYSGGIGRDITFEHALVKNYGCSVVLFDPTPTGTETINLPENKIPNFKYHAVALSGACGTLKLSRPTDEDEGSWFKHSDGDPAIEVPCVDVSTLMKMNGHDHIDILKIDIEGSEYEVIDDILKRRLPVKQILVEFHNNLLPGVSRNQTVRAILKMAFSGYRLINKEGENYSFISPSLLKKFP